MHLSTRSPTAQNVSIGVASRLHIQTGVAGELLQLSHGKKAPLQWADMRGRLVAGLVETDEGYRVEIYFVDCYEAPSMPLMDVLTSVKSDALGDTFWFGSLTVPATGFALISEQMGAPHMAGKNGDAVLKQQRPSARVATTGRSQRQ